MPSKHYLSLDQFDQLTLPLSKAKSLLELLAHELPGDEGAVSSVAQDLISEAQTIARSFTHSGPAADVGEA